MGTNFYWIEDKGFETNDHIEQHIGKRSAAGYYCYDCGTTLNRGGTDMVHQGGTDDIFNAWLDACPSCNKEKEVRDFSASTGGVELGVASATAVKKSGVSTCCSFTWTLMKHKRKIEELAKSDPDKKVIVDEYNREHSARAFIEMLEICPIEFQSPCEFS